MSFRMPSASIHQLEQASVDTALNVEILEEKAAALGRAGRRVEKTLATLQACDDTDPSRRDHVRAAADAVYTYLIQRELCGLRDQQAVYRSYKIPAEVIAILGAS